MNEIVDRRHQFIETVCDEVRAGLMPLQPFIKVRTAHFITNIMIRVDIEAERRSLTLAFCEAEMDGYKYPTDITKQIAADTVRHLISAKARCRDASFRIASLPEEEANKCE